MSHMLNNAQSLLVISSKATSECYFSSFRAPLVPPFTCLRCSTLTTLTSCKRTSSLHYFSINFSSKLYAEFFLFLFHSMRKCFFSVMKLMRSLQRLIIAPTDFKSSFMLLK